MHASPAADHATHMRAARTFAQNASRSAWTCSARRFRSSSSWISLGSGIRGSHQVLLSFASHFLLFGQHQNYPGYVPGSPSSRRVRTFDEVNLLDLTRGHVGQRVDGTVRNVIDVHPRQYVLGAHVIW